MQYDENKRKISDDFNWDDYSKEHYIPQAKEQMERLEMFLLKDTYIENGKIIEKDNVHFNSINICKDVLKYKPKSVFECGCGAGYHLQNIKHLFPKTIIAGCDLLRSQVKDAGKFLKVKKSITDNILVLDFLDDNSVSEILHTFFREKFDYVFTNAVVMHLNFENAVKFIENMIKLNPDILRINEGQASQQNWDEIYQESGLFDKYDKTDDMFVYKIK